MIIKMLREPSRTMDEHSKKLDVSNKEKNIKKKVHI